MDPLLSELCGFLTSVPSDGVSASLAIRASIIDALAVVLVNGGDKATAVGLEKVKYALVLLLLLLFNFFIIIFSQCFIIAGSCCNPVLHS